MRAISGLAAGALALAVIAVPAAVAGQTTTITTKGATDIATPFQKTVLPRASTDELTTQMDSYLGTTYTTATTTQAGTVSSPRDLVVSALDDRGHVQWTHAVGGPQQDVAVAVAAGWWGVLVLSSVSDDPYGEEPVGAEVRLFDTAGDLVWSRRHDDRLPVHGLAAHGGSYYLAGGDEPGASGGTSSFSVQRFALADGRLRAHQGGFINPGQNVWSDIAVVDDDIVVAGTSDAAGVYQAVVRRLDGRTLQQQWRGSVDTSDIDGASNLAVRDGRVLVTGTTTGRLGYQHAYGQSDVWLASFGAAGGVRRWVRQMGTDANDYNASVTGTPYGPAVVFGSYSLWGDTAAMTLRRFDQDGNAYRPARLWQDYPPQSVDAVDWDWGSLVIAGSDWNDVLAPDREIDSFVARFALSGSLS